MQKLVIGSALAIILTAIPAYAQDERPVSVNFGFGWTLPLSDLGDTFDAGWNGTFGITYHVTPTLGVQTEYMYQKMNGPDRTITISGDPTGTVLIDGLLESNHQFHAFTFNLVTGRKRADKPIGGYGVAGVGFYHRTVQITSPSVGYIKDCDPYLLVCSPGYVAINTYIGDRTSNDFGVDFGGGMTFRLRNQMQLYVEARYHYVWGPKVTPNTPNSTTSYSTNAEYFPITIGIRW